jgi:hypothetical protein
MFVAKVLSGLSNAADEQVDEPDYWVSQAQQWRQHVS